MHFDLLYFVYCRYVVDFTDMIQENPLDKTKIQICRRH